MDTAFIVLVFTAEMAAILTGRVLSIALSRRCCYVNERLRSRNAGAGSSFFRQCSLTVSASRSVVVSPSSFNSPVLSCGNRRVEAIRNSQYEAHSHRRKVKVSAATTQATSSVDTAGKEAADEYEAVIGIETHIQLATETKVCQKKRRAIAEFRCCDPMFTDTMNCL